MVFHVLTLFPEMIENAASYSILGKALSRGHLSLDVVNIRDYTDDPHRKVDDEPYGGGAGMLMQAQPVYDAFRAVEARIPEGHRKQVYYLSPKAHPMTQTDVKRMAAADDLVLVCGHYEGIDERVLEEISAQPLSIGDYILTGGELAALVVMDATSRFLDGVLHNAVSAETETFSGHLLEYPQYTRPPVWKDREVPQVLLSGHAENIRQWRREESIRLTRAYRPDLYEKFTAEDAFRTRLWKDRKNGALFYNALETASPRFCVLTGTDDALYDINSHQVWCRVRKDAEEEDLRALFKDLFETEGLTCETAHVMTAKPEQMKALLSEYPQVSYRACSMAVYTPRLLPSRSKWARGLAKTETAVPEEIRQMMDDAEAVIAAGQIPMALFHPSEKPDFRFLASFDIYLSDYQVFTCFF